MMDEVVASLAAGLRAGGLFVYPLMALALVAIGCAVDRAYVFRRLSRFPKPLAHALAQQAVDLQHFREALARTSAYGGYHALFGAIMDNADRPIWWIETRAADEAAQIERRLDQGLWVLETIVTAAPLLGLLGTISGMIGAFRLFGAAGAVDPAAVTGGVAEALVSTAFGIAIALVALAAFNYFGHRRAAMLDDIERLGTRVIDSIRLDRGDER